METKKRPPNWVLNPKTPLRASDQWYEKQVPETRKPKSSRKEEQKLPIYLRK